LTPSVIIFSYPVIDESHQKSYTGAVLYQQQHIMYRRDYIMWIYDKSRSCQYTKTLCFSYIGSEKQIFILSDNKIQDNAMIPA